MWAESEIHTEGWFLIVPRGKNRGLSSAGLCFVRLMQARVIREEETSAGKMTQADWPVGKSVEHLLD